MIIIVMIIIDRGRFGGTGARFSRHVSTRASACSIQCDTSVLVDDVIPRRSCHRPSFSFPFPISFLSFLFSSIFHRRPRRRRRETPANRRFACQSLSGVARSLENARDEQSKISARVYACGYTRVVHPTRYFSIFIARNYRVSVLAAARALAFRRNASNKLMYIHA